MIGSVRDRETFRRLRATGSRGRSGPVRVLYLPHDQSTPLVAFAISRRFGSAVDRNRARRRMKAILRAGPPELISGSYLFTCQRSVLTMPHTDLASNIRRALSNATSVESA